MKTKMIGAWMLGYTESGDGTITIALNSEKHKRLLRHLDAEEIRMVFGDRQIKIRLHRKGTSEQVVVNATYKGIEQLRRQLMAWEKFISVRGRMGDMQHELKPLIREEAIEYEDGSDRIWLVTGSSQPFVSTTEAAEEARKQLSAWLKDRATIDMIEESQRLKVQVWAHNEQEPQRLNQAIEQVVDGMSYHDLFDKAVGVRAHEKLKALWQPEIPLPKPREPFQIADIYGWQRGFEQ